MLIRYPQFRLLAGPSSIASKCLGFSPIPSKNWSQSHFYSSSTESFPRIAQPSLWHSIVPKFLRKSNNPQLKPKAPKSKEWNPATFYIVIFLLIGSNAIQMIALKNDFTSFSRKADAKIGLLKEVLDRVERGEDVDVEGLLGTGNKEKEKEWDEGNAQTRREPHKLGFRLAAEVANRMWTTVLREIEEEDQLWQSKDKKRPKPATAEMNNKESTSPNPTVIVNTGKDAVKVDEPDRASIEKPRRTPVGFY